MSKTILALAALCALLPAAHAAGRNQALGDCVELSPAHEMARFGSQYLLVKDGDAYYRLGFGGTCAAIAQATRIELRAEGKAGRLCPQGTQVVARVGSCTVRDVALISQEQYENYARRGRSR
ncbi:MAG TPA: hypothetical protein VM619_10955 [Luteimonas sp.]|nr:hypothetical protein [Luteimonas sp.]